MIAFILHLGNMAFDDHDGNAAISSDEILNIIDSVCNSQLLVSAEFEQVQEPRAGSGVVRMDPLRFLAGCRTRRLNQA